MDQDTSLLDMAKILENTPQTMKKFNTSLTKSNSRLSKKNLKLRSETRKISKLQIVLALFSLYNHFRELDQKVKAFEQERELFMKEGLIYIPAMKQHVKIGAHVASRRNAGAKVNQAQAEYNNAVKRGLPTNEIGKAKAKLNAAEAYLKSLKEGQNATGKTLFSNMQVLRPNKKGSEEVSTNLSDNLSMANYFRPTSSTVPSGFVPRNEGPFQKPNIPKQYKPTPKWQMYGRPNTYTRKQGKFRGRG